MSQPHPTDAPRSPNRLARATSPYLLQHADNPVDWYEWGPEALERARRENKPIFLSIGYSACHWCHVMAHESFMNPDTAALLNEFFINIKVDREERPDLDELYMRATVIYTRGHGGWPMSVWLTPDLRPFAAGTYFPPDDRYGRPGFPRICRAIHEAWTTRRSEINQAASVMADAVIGSLQPAGGPGTALTLADVDRVADALAGAFDAEYGGLLSGATNKFPPSMALDLLLRSAWRRQDDAAAHARLLAPVRTTLDRMAAGGIRDHLAGGFARYSTDPRWHVPHFEKMLYDQALVARAYVDGWLATGDEAYAAVAREICDYVLADLRDPAGGFYSARDADSEGEEGRYYVWTHAEIVAALGEPRAARFARYYDVRPAGNWDDPHAPGVAKNVLHTPRPLDAVAREFDMSADELRAELAAARATLTALRDRRVAPARDDKVLCEWNGLMIASLARAGAALDEPRYVDAAAAAAEFIWQHQQRDGRLHRAWRAGRTLPTAFLADYANLIDGLLELYEATFAPHWLDRALVLNGTVLTHYADARRGGFYTTADDHEQLLTRPMEIADGAVPSGNSVQYQNLLRLAHLTGDDRLRAHADRLAAVFSPQVREHVRAGERFLAGVDFALAGPLEIVVVGDPTAADTRALLRQVRTTYLPSRVVLLADTRPAGRSIRSPLLENRPPVDGRATVYVCRNGTCQRPVTTPADLAELLKP